MQFTVHFGPNGPIFQQANPFNGGHVIDIESTVEKLPFPCDEEVPVDNLPHNDESPDPNSPLTGSAQ